MIGLICAAAILVASPQAPSDRAVQSIRTGKFPQWQREFITSKDGLPNNEVRSVAVLPSGDLLVVAGGKASVRKTNAWSAVPINSQSVCTGGGFKDADGRVGAEDGVYALRSGAWSKEANSPKGVIAFSKEPSGIAWALTATAVFRCDGGWKLVNELDEDTGEVRSLCATGPDNCYLATSRGMFGLMGKRKYWVPMSIAPGTLPSQNVGGITSLNEGHLAVATDKGLTLTDGRRGWQTFQGKEGLPILGLGAITNSSKGTLWMGSQEGLISLEDGAFRYWAGGRWLPDNRVNCIADAPDGSVWVGTQGGLSHIYAENMNLEQKAVRMQQQIERGPRRHGFVTILEMPEPGSLKGALQEISDNDGSWTGAYVSAHAFRYGATKDSKAKEIAWKSMQALLRLESITGIKGFPARAIAHESEPQFKKQGLGNHPEWHPSKIEKGWWWKGDTSSDELDAHYFTWYIYATAVNDPEHNKAIAATCKRVTDHLLDNNLTLVDFDGKPTTWGVWSPEKINDDPMWWEEHGLNALEILSHLKVAHHLTGEARYDRAYRDLIRKHNYGINVYLAKLEGNIDHDDELAMYAFYPLLQLEKDPGLRALYLAGLTRLWKLERPEENPLWNFIYGVSAGKDCDAEAAVRSLKEMPLDLIKWKMRNSHRLDLKMQPDPRNPAKQIPLTPLPWLERPTHKWDKNPYALDDGNGHIEEDATMWLLPYWMGRFYGFIE